MGEATSSERESTRFAKWKSRLVQYATAWRARLSTEGGQLTFALNVTAVLFLAEGLRRLFGPLFEDLANYGIHDWDGASAYRFVAPVAARYFEAPWWNPFSCGGISSWGYPEGSTNFISPYYPIYLIFKVQVAERIEVVGQTVLCLVGTYLLAGRFTRSVAARLVVAILYGMNGRWTMQGSMGHTWHLQYALFPLAFYYFDKALEPGRWRQALGTGVVFALMVYWGGIYPLPHAALSLTFYAVLLSLFRWTWRPLPALAVAGVSAFGLSAPKLLAIGDLMSRYPRKTASDEVTGPAELWTFFTDPTQSSTHGIFPTPAWGWHEYGAYIGYGGVLVLVVGLVLGLERRALAFKLIGLFYILVSFGQFHRFAPWSILHALPVFSSQHVPSRSIQPAILFIGLAFASFFGRRLDRAIERKPWLDLVFLVPVVFLMTDLTTNGVLSTTHIFSKKISSFTRSSTFHHQHLPDAAYYPQDWDGQNIPAMLQNVGSLKCYGYGTIEVGAIARGSVGYHGEASFVEGEGKATVTRWSLNQAVVEYAGATPGSTLVYNMNYDASWSANGERALDVSNRVGTRVTADHGRVVFRYFPRTLKYGLLIFVVTAVAALWPQLRRLVAWAKARRAQKTAATLA
jgi:hypothetical protein